VLEYYYYTAMTKATMGTQYLATAALCFSALGFTAMSCQGGGGEASADKDAAACSNPAPAHFPDVCCDGSEDSPASEQLGTEGGFSVVWLSATPALPAVGTNALRVRVLDSNSSPVDGLSFDKVQAFFGGALASGTPNVTPVGSNGEYDISMLQLADAGQWSVNMEISANGLSDSVSFLLCVQ